MCEAEAQNSMQRGMNYRMNPEYSVILMSQRNNAPYQDNFDNELGYITYEGHDIPVSNGLAKNPKLTNQERYLPSGKLAQNGKFAKAVDDYRLGLREPEKVKVYEKVMDGVWSMKGIFKLVDYIYKTDGNRLAFFFRLKIISDYNNKRVSPGDDINLSHTRLIPSYVKKEVWKRDHGRCVICGSTTNLHFDHDLPFSKGGTSLSSNNIRILCARCNLKKSDKIE